jgi:NarL family two-component system response regulator LiaR
VDSQRPIRVALTNDFELVVAGLAHMLQGFDDRIAVLDPAVHGDTVDRQVDVALFDTFGHVGDGMDERARSSCSSPRDRATWTSRAP